MSFKFNCPKCGHRLDVDGGMKGKLLQCSICGNRFLIPGKGEAGKWRLRLFWAIFVFAILAGGYFIFFHDNFLNKQEVEDSLKSDFSDRKENAPLDDSKNSKQKGAIFGKESKIAENSIILPSIKPDKKEVNNEKGSEMTDLTNAGSGTKNDEKALMEHKIEVRDGENYLWIEAEDADTIEPSFEIDYDEECSGGKFLSHPEDTGSSWAKSKVDGRDVPCGVGRADYTIKIPSGGDWYLWGRVKWETGCSDCFDVFIDDAKPLRRKDVFIAHQFNLEMLGKDNTLDSWHWISSQYFKLEPGLHTLSLRNHDDGSHIDRMLLTDDASFRPQGLGDCHFQRGAGFWERIHKGENFYLAWFIDMEVKSGNWLAKKDRLFPDENDAVSRALILDGEDWWKDYQLVFLLYPPESGRAGAVFYHVDEENFYELAFDGTSVELSKVLGGERRKLSTKQVPGNVAEWMLKTAKNKRAIRVTINRFGERIGVFIDGVRIFDIQDGGLKSGKAGFFSEWAKGFAIDDYEIASVAGADEVGRNERIEWFCGRKVRVFNSVLDSFGATGGFHPGDYRDKRDEAHLAALQKNIGGRNVGKEAKLLDWLWLTFNPDVFREKHGMSKGAGYIVAQTHDEEKEAFLWTPVILHGDWDFEFRVAGEAKEFNIHLVEAVGNPDKAWKKVIPLVGYLKNGENVNAGERWKKFRLSCRLRSLSISRDGVKISDLGEIPDRGLRLALSMKAGTVLIDTVSASLHPVLFYDFKYNTPWGLALSDWSLHGVERIEHGGGYYNYLVLSPNRKESSKRSRIATRRLFSGNFSAMIELDLENSSNGEPFKTLSLGFINAKGFDEKIVLSRNLAVKFDKVSRKNIAKLNNFITEKRRMTQVFLSVRDGNAFVFLNDDDGTMRPLDCGHFANPAGAFRFFIGGEPELRISRVLIWGEELE